MKSLFKAGGIVVLFALLVSSALIWLLIVHALAQQEPDSTQMKLVLEKVQVTVRKRAQYELLKGMVGECPPLDSTHGEPWEFVINQWQRKQLEGIGAKVRVIAEIKPEEKPKQTEYKLVREIDLGADGVENIILGPKRDKSSALSEINLGLKDEGEGWIKVNFYDYNFNLIGEMRLRDVIFSKDLRYIGGIEYVEYPSVYHEDTLLSGEIENTEEKRIHYKFQLFDYTGKKLWELKERVLHEVNCTYSISNRGTVIELDHGSGVVAFIDQQGNEINKIKICSSNGTPGEGIGGGIFSDDGEYALIVADESCLDTLEKKVRVLFFTWDGGESWRFTTNENFYTGGGISKLGNYMIVSSLASPPSSYPPDEKSTYLLSKNGELIKRYDNILGSLICFSSNEKYALFNSPYEGAFLIDLPSGEVLLKYGPLAGFHLAKSLDIDIAEDAKIFGFIACHPGIESFIKEKKGNIEVVLFGFDGLRIWSDFFTSADYRLLSPVNLSLSDDGKQIVIQIGTKIMIYQKGE